MGDGVVKTEEEVKPVITNPHEFFEGFRNSERYQDAFSKFYEGKTLAADATEDEKRKIFEENEGVKEALIEYARQDTNFKYDPASGFYSPEIVKALKDYIAQVEETEKLDKKGGSQDDIQKFDSFRSGLHSIVAAALTANGITPNERIGKAFANLVLIQYGLNTYKKALIPDAARTQYVVGGSNRSRKPSPLF